MALKFTNEACVEVFGDLRKGQYMHTYMKICLHTYNIYIYTFIYIRTYVHMYVYKQKYNVHVYIYIYMYVCVYLCTQCVYVLQP